MAAADALAAEGWSVGVINARFAKPLDRQLILDQARGKRLVVTFEESVVTGGFGSGVLEAVEEARLTDPAYRDVAVRIVGHPGRPLRRPRLGGRPAAGAPARRRGLAAQVRETLATLELRPKRPRPMEVVPPQ